MKKFLLLLIIVFTVPARLLSQNAPTLAPINPDFVRFMEKLNSGKYPMPGTNEFGTGGIPPPGIVNFDNYLKNNKLKSTDFDPVYDLRTTGLLTPVKGQTGNACWAFATMASVESGWLALGLGSWDLSENNLKYCHRFDVSRDTWGNHWMSTAYFARRSGPLVEADDPNSTFSICPTGKIPVGYIADARYLPNDMNTIKQAILDHGAIYTMMYINTSITYYNPVDFTYYRGDSADVNHAVDLVGWDDNKVTAGGTGAWICKNSYGTGWGEAGYFYVSYNDQTILDYNAYWPTRYDYKAEDFVYGYDDLGNYGATGYGKNVGYMLVKFVASGSQLLSKIGTYANTSGETIDIDIFDNFNIATNTLTGQLSHQGGLSCPFPGYYTFDLSAPTVIAQGNDFYVRIRYQTPDTARQIPIEYKIAGYSDPVIESNLAWISSNPSVWDWVLIGNTTDFKWDPCVKVYAEPVITWTGTSSADWNTPGNWSTNAIPTASQYICIPDITTQPVINQNPASPAICNHLNIEQGATLTLASGKALTVNGTLTNNAGNTGLIIESGASLITMGNVTGTATVNRAITGNEWHFISAPVSDAFSGIFTGKYLQKHTESTNAYTYISSVSEALEPLKGYELWGLGNFTASYTGQLNTGLNSISLARTSDNLFNSGWNIVGNPYPSSINWDAATGWDKFNVNSTIYIVNKGEWATYVSGNPGVGTNGGTQYIASGQGFFVSVANVGSGNLAMDNRVRVHNTTTFLKNSGAGSLVRLKVSGNGYSDEAIVRLIPEATDEFDGQYDAIKLFGYNKESAQIYTLGSIPLTINSLPPGVQKVPLGIQASISGKYTITATETGNLNNVTLEDTKNGILTQLTTKPYSFTFESGEKEQRFKLYLNTSIFTEIDDTESSVAAVYSSEQNVHVDLNDQVKGNILIYNIEGQLVAAKTQARGMNSFGLPFAGIYIVRVITAENTMVRKVWIF